MEDRKEKIKGMSNILIGIGIILILFLVFAPIGYLSGMPNDLDMQLNFSRVNFTALGIGLIGVALAGVGLWIKEKSNEQRMS